MNRRLRIAITRHSDWSRLARRADFQPVRMAESAGVSIKHLHRLCRNQMAEAFGSWLLRERLIAARHLLAETGSVKETARRLGFRYRAHFSREFLRAYGLSASAFATRFKEWR
jgi:AraC-like DNA-binding protein